MGKIFDALEKAGSQPTSSQKLPPKKKKGKSNKELVKIKNNVVPFEASNQPAAHGGFNDKLVTYHQPNSVESEIFKVLRTNLLFPLEGKPPKSLMVTSALPGDGKSFVSGNLAISLAHGVEEHVLLVDADIRNPSIDEMFGLGGKKGLSEYLAKGADVGDNLVKTVVDKLTILPAGKSPHNPTELLTTKKMRRLLDEVTNRYDDRFIIVDTAPPSLASETAAISNYVDGIIIVVRAGKTPRNAVNDVIEQLGKEKILGVVLNCSDQSRRKYYGYGKSYYMSQ